jgi:hypothetical protein
MIKHRASHVDHGLTEGQLRYLLDRFADQRAFFLKTIELPEDLGTVSCGLFGPLVGDPPIAEAAVTYAIRGTRAWTSRLIDREPRQVRSVTIIAGPHEEACDQCEGGRCVSLAIPGPGGPSWYPCRVCEGSGKISHACIIYTAFGGPATPQEPGDPSCKDPVASNAFWREHALAK